MRHFFTKAIVCAGVVASALALSSMAVFAATITTESVFDAKVACENADVGSGETATLENSVELNNITFVATEALNAALDNNQKADFGSGNITGSINTNGATNVKNNVASRYFTFETGSAMKVSVYYRTGGKDRSIGIISGTPTGAISLSNDNSIAYYASTGTDVGILEATLPTAGTYSIVTSKSASRIYKVVVTPASAQDIEVSLTAKDSVTTDAVTGFSVYLKTDTTFSNAITADSTTGKYALKTLTDYIMVKDGYANAEFTVSGDTEVELTPTSFPVTVTATSGFDGSNIDSFTVYNGETQLSINSTTGKYSLSPDTTYTVKADGYDDVTFTVTSDNYTSGKAVELMPTGVKTYTLNNTDITSATIVGDTVKNGFLICNYTKQGSSGKYIQVNENSGILFKTTGAAKLTFSKVKQGGSEGTRILVVKKADGTVVFSTNTTSTEEPVNVDIAEAGTYYILGSGTTETKTAVNIGSISVLGTLDTPTPQVEVLAPTSGKAGIARVDDKYYALAVVTADEANANSAVKFNDTAVEEIYKEAGVSFTNSRKTVFDPALLGGSGYVVGIELDVSDLTDTSLDTLQDKVAVTLEAME